ncbi:hypothetical protein SNE40_011859 [Patella caerulea]|uniref:Uncharacterized protein n=1 Tax=Patella caerulea TaxID=87958 RepID=A0AAN8JQ70_PATCE
MGIVGDVGARKPMRAFRGDMEPMDEGEIGIAYGGLVGRTARLEGVLMDVPSPDDNVLLLGVFRFSVSWRRFCALCIGDGGAVTS